MAEIERRKERMAIETKAIEDLQSHMAAEDKRMDRSSRWHVGKEVPIATILVLLAQTVGVVAWAASTTTKVDYLKESQVALQIVQSTVDKRQDDESQRAESRVISRLDKLDAKIDALIAAKGR